MDPATAKFVWQITASAAAVVVILSQVQIARYDRLKGSVSAAKRERDAADQRVRSQEIASELKRVQGMLEPFVELASSKHPGVPVQDALAELRSDLSRTRELADRATRKIQTEDREATVLQAVSRWASASPTTTVRYSLGSADLLNARQESDALKQLLVRAGVRLFEGSSAGMTGGRARGFTVSYPAGMKSRECPARC